jgi:hypothetical protein
MGNSLGVGPLIISPRISIILQAIWFCLDKGECLFPQIQTPCNGGG